jgi:uncharacterized protein
MKFAEILFTNSGSIFEATRYARPCEVSRTTVANYLSVLEATYVVHVVKPYSSHKTSEIVSAPKVYGFDTGFVCYHRGWASLRNEDKGLLWEHFVLNEMQGFLQTRRIQYWRDKRGHEVDFVFPVRQGSPIAVECKWKQSDFDARNLISFRRQYPEGENLVVSSDVERPYRRAYGAISVLHTGLSDLITDLRGLVSG